MTYEELLALQERTGFVSKGMTVQEMDQFPVIPRSEVKKYIKRQNGQNEAPKINKLERVMPPDQDTVE